MKCSCCKKPKTLREDVEYLKGLSDMLVWIGMFNMILIIGVIAKLIDGGT